MGLKRGWLERDATALRRFFFVSVGHAVGTRGPQPILWKLEFNFFERADSLAQLALGICPRKYRKRFSAVI